MSWPRALAFVVATSAGFAAESASSQLTITRPRDPAGFDWPAIEAVTQTCWTKISAHLALDAVEIRFNHGGAGIIPEVGVGGYCPSAKLIFIDLAPNRPDWRENLCHALAHESHHAARWRTVGYGRTLGESMVTEGLAERFATELLEIPPGPWAHALSPEQLSAARAQALPALWHEPYAIADHRAWFFGAPAQKIARWTGYTLGYQVVADYLLKHPDARAATLVATPARTIFHDAGWQ